MKNILLMLLLFGSAITVMHAQPVCANHCLNFDGKDDYVQLSQSPVLGNVNFTIEGWFRSMDNDGLTNCPAGNFERIIGCGGSRLEIGECSGKFSVFLGPAGFLNSGVSTSDTKWHYFAVTKDGGAFRIYLDATMVLSYDLPAGTAFNLDNVFRIGQWPGPNTTPENWQGDVDEVRVWDSALPESSLWESRDCKLTGQESGLVDYYNFDQGTPGGTNGSVNSLLDLASGSSSNPGTLNGFALTGALSNWVCSGSPQAVLCSDPGKNMPVTLTPENNGTYKIGAVPNFSWKWNGAFPPPTQYVLEVFLLEATGPKVVFSNSVDVSSLPAATVLGANPTKGIYQWQVTAAGTGQQSKPSYFTLGDASCGTVSATITAVCKDWGPNGLPTYTVTLTLTNTATVGSAGCPVKYNTFVPVGGSIGPISPVLPSTIAAGATQSFTFIFTPASLLQTSIVMQCFGNWQDPLLNTANLQINGPLPPCLCNDCKVFGATNVTATQVPGDPSKWNLSGNLSTTGLTGPITAVEFQVKTFSFGATPGTCSNGVTSVESSGVFLTPSSSINGSTALVFFNETISPPVPPTNNNASKDIKWIGGPVVNPPTPIPFNLTIGLPSPLAGLNADCCKMRYRICVKATVFYGDNQCRACTAVFCKDFTN